VEVTGSIPGRLGQVVDTHMYLCHQQHKFGTGYRAVMPCCWEGNRRSGITLAMRHRLQLFIHLLVCGLRKGNKHPAYTPRHTSLNFHRFIPAFLGGLVTELTSFR